MMDRGILDFSLIPWRNRPMVVISRSSNRSTYMMKELCEEYGIPNPEYEISENETKLQKLNQISLCCFSKRMIQKTHLATFYKIFH